MIRELFYPSGAANGTFIPIVKGGAGQSYPTINSYTTDHASPFVRPVEWPAMDTIVPGTHKYQIIYEMPYFSGSRNLSVKVSGTNTVLDWGDGGATTNTGTVTFTTFIRSINWATLNVPYYTYYPIYNITVSANTVVSTHQNIGPTPVIFNSVVGTGLTNDGLYFLRDAQVYLSPDPNATPVDISGVTSANMYVAPYKAICMTLTGDAIGRFHEESSLTALGREVEICANSTSLTIVSTYMAKLISIGENGISSWNFGSAQHLIKCPQGINFGGITNFTNMFKNCVNLVEAPATIPSGATLLTSMFENCYNLRTVPNYNTSNVTNFSSMFKNCHSLSTAPNLNFSNATNCSYMFDGCSNLHTVPNYTFTQSNVNLTSLFFNCANLVNLPILTIPTGANCTGLFASTGVQTAPAIDLSNASSIASLFSSCANLVDTTNITWPSGNTSYAHVFKASGIQEIAKTGVDFSKVTSLNYTFHLSRLTGDINLTLPVCTDLSHAFDTCPSIVNLTIEAPVVTGMSYMVADSLILQSVIFTGTHSATIISTNYCFSGCLRLKYVNLSNYTIRGSDHISMFQSCFALQEVYAPDLLFAGNCDYMFASCYALTKLTVKNPDVTNTLNAITSWRQMFSAVNLLEELPPLKFSKTTFAAGEGLFYHNALASGSGLKRLTVYACTGFALTFNMFGGNTTNWEYANFELNILAVNSTSGINSLESNLTVLKAAIVILQFASTFTNTLNPLTNISWVKTLILKNLPYSIRFQFSASGGTAAFYNEVFTGLNNHPNPGTNSTLTFLPSPLSVGADTSIATSKGWTVA